MNFTELLHGLSSLHQELKIRPSFQHMGSFLGIMRSFVSTLFFNGFVACSAAQLMWLAVLIVKGVAQQLS
jgi:hypothetical protein